MTLARRVLGIKGEAAAVNFLSSRGYRILERNFRCRLGEIDIVARQGNCIVFIEVRSRSSDKFGLPQESVTAAKRNKLRRLAQAYLAQRSYARLNVRFDVIAVLIGPELRVTHIENAF